MKATWKSRPLHDHDLFVISRNWPSMIILYEHIVLLARSPFVMISPLFSVLLSCALAWLKRWFGYVADGRFWKMSCSIFPSFHPTAVVCRHGRKREGRGFFSGFRRWGWGLGGGPSCAVVALLKKKEKNLFPRKSWRHRQNPTVS